jgi:hypothetical protein
LRCALGHNRVMRNVIGSLLIVAVAAVACTSDDPTIDATEGFMSAMEAEGYDVYKGGGAGYENAFGETGQWVSINGHGVVAMEFASEVALAAATSGLRRVPGAFRTNTGLVDLIPSTPHPRFYAQGRLLIIDLAPRDPIAADLEQFMGAPPGEVRRAV